MSHFINQGIRTRPEADLSQNASTLPGNKEFSREENMRLLIQKSEFEVGLLAVTAHGGRGLKAASYMNIMDFSGFSGFPLCSQAEAVSFDSSW